jgi:hypothetical protein
MIVIGEWPAMNQFNDIPDVVRQGYRARAGWIIDDPFMGVRFS